MSDESTGDEKNVIFLFPISASMVELKKELEKDPSYTIYEVDALQEYAQLIGVTPGSITFCSDTSKTQKAFDAHDKLIKKTHTKFFLSSEKKVSPVDFLNLQKKGLHEQIENNISKKAITYKINLLFKAQQKRTKAEQSKKIDTKEKVRVEKGVTIGKETKEEEEVIVKQIDNGPEDSKGKLNDYSGYGDAASIFTNKTKIKKMAEVRNTRLIGNFQHLKNRHFNLNDFGNDPELKKVNNPFAGQDEELQKRKHSGMVDVLNDYKRKEVTQLDDVDPLNPEKLNNSMQDYWAEESKKKKTFEEVEADWDLKKNKNTQDNQIDQEKKSYLNPFDQQELSLKKSTELKEFDPLNPDKKEHNWEHEELLKKQKKDLHDQSLDLDNMVKGNKDQLEALEAKKKKDFNFENFDSEQANKLKKEYEEILEKKKKSKLTDEELNLEKKLKESLEDQTEKDKIKLKKFQTENLDLNNQKKLNNLENEEDLKRKKLNELESLDEFGRPKIKSLDENLDLSKKKSNFEETNLDLNQKKSKFEEEFNNEKKKHQFQEEKISTYWGQKKTDTLKLEKVKKIIEDVEIDYSWAKNKKTQGELKLPIIAENIKDYDFHQSVIDEELESFIFYPPDNLYGIYLVYLSQFVYEDKPATEKTAKFIQFILQKTYTGFTSFYRLIESNNEQTIMEIFSGHKLNPEKIQPLFDNPWEEVIEEWWKQWSEITTPWWSDHTWRDEVQTFVFPYYDGPKKLGFAITHVLGIMKDDQDAKNIELLMSSMRSYFLFGTH